MILLLQPLVSSKFHLQGLPYLQSVPIFLRFVESSHHPNIDAIRASEIRYISNWTAQRTTKKKRHVAIRHPLYELHHFIRENLSFKKKGTRMNRIHLHQHVRLELIYPRRDTSVFSYQF